MPKEIWKDIYEFEEYGISNRGRVINHITDRIKTPSVNQHGIPHVLFVKDRIQYRRTVALLVANAFLPRYREELDNYPDHFDTPINLNGDRLDNCVENLMWRPRWFVVKYHQQMKNGPRTNYPSRPIMDEDTEEIYSSQWEAATKLGLLEGDIVVAVFNKEAVFPGGYRFCFVKNDLVDIN